MSDVIFCITNNIYGDITKMPDSLNPLVIFPEEVYRKVAMFYITEDQFEAEGYDRNAVIDLIKFHDLNDFEDKLLVFLNEYILEIIDNVCDI